ncbi:hypothetical protein [Novosphingobium sp. AAP1]|uniref:hypothetical protein n=1 Tax=Novosphingobium sp. AAP1 TaxID=1523413 RepID=UPI000AA8BEB5|nr:hypothetical protein [Novosphingobium sp. AAP1]
MAKITRHALGEALDLKGKFGRITVACDAQTLQSQARAEEADVQQMTLDIDVRARL